MQDFLLTVVKRHEFQIEYVNNHLGIQWIT